MWVSRTRGLSTQGHNWVVRLDALRLQSDGMSAYSTTLISEFLGSQQRASLIYRRDLLFLFSVYCRLYIHSLACT